MPVSHWRHPHLLLEERAESRGIGEVEDVGYLLYALVRRGYERDGTLRYRLKHQLLHRAARHRLNQGREVFRRQTQTVGIEADTSLTVVITVDELHELHVGLELARRSIVVMLREFVEDAA